MTATYETIELERYLFGAALQLKEDFDINAELSVQQTGLLDQWLVVTMKASIFGEQVLYEEVRYPKDWWQAFKDRWFPLWAKKRWPPKFTLRTFDARFVYPSIKSDEHQSYKYTILKDIDYTWEDG